MPLLPHIANRIWQLASRRKLSRFRKAAADPQTAQTTYLLNLLKKNAATTYGKIHRFGSISSIRDYQKSVPLSSYETYLPYIQEIIGGADRVLTDDPVRLLEPTSGTSSASKLIPYTDALRSEFQQGIAPWIYDLFRRYPALRGGSAYWAVTPKNHSFNLQEILPGAEHSAIPIGFAEDSEYFGRFEKMLVDRVMTVPGLLAGVESTDNFRYLTLRFLLADAHLRLISVWNPTFLTLLLAALPPWKEQVLRDIATGNLNPPQPLPKRQAAAFRALFHPLPRRAARLQEVLGGISDWQRVPWTEVWPRLGLISCWGSAWAENYFAALKNRFPGVVIQPKGLLATEALVSFPFADGHVPGAAPVLSINSHFFEFEDLGNGEILTVEQLVDGNEYAVIVTTGGGLYRYRLNDRVRVSGFFRKTPRLHFLGKAARISDIFGEKLHEDFLRTVLQQQFAAFGLSPDFYFVAPEINAGSGRYVLYLGGRLPEPRCAALAGKVEAALARNYHYHHCRSLGQLQPLTIRLLPEGAAGRYLDFRGSGGAMTTVKQRLLEDPQDWEAILGSQEG